VAQSETQFGPGAPGHSHGRPSRPAGDWCGGVSAPDPAWCGGGEPPEPWCDTGRTPVQASTAQASTGLVLLGAVAGLARALGRRQRR
jgi:hypothetical protein